MLVICVLVRNYRIIFLSKAKGNSNKTRCRGNTMFHIRILPTPRLAFNSQLQSIWFHRCDVINWRRKPQWRCRCFMFHQSGCVYTNPRFMVPNVYLSALCRVFPSKGSLLHFCNGVVKIIWVYFLHAWSLLLKYTPRWEFQI